MAIRQQQAIADFGLQGLRASDSLAELFGLAAADACAGLEADFASVFELKAGGAELELVASTGWVPAGGRVVAPADGDSAVAQALRAIGPILVTDRSGAVGTVTELNGVRSSAAMVIRQNGDVFGVLAVHSRRARWFGEADLLFLRSLTNILAATLARRTASETIERLAAVVGQSFDAIVSRTLDGTITSWNTGAERVFGYSTEEMVGRNMRTLDLEDPDDGLGKVNERLRAGETVVRFEGSRVRKDGTRIRVEVTVSPVDDADGVLTGAAVIMRDVTQTRSLEQQLRQSQRLESLGRLSSGIAHDFNNALTVIRLQLELLALHTELRPFEPALAEIRAATDHAAALTAQLLAFGGQQQLEPSLVNLNDVIAKLISMVAPLIGESVNLTFSPQPDLHPVLTDTVQMEQVFMNLAINARDAMPAGGELTIETTNVWLGEPDAAELVDAPPGWYALVSVTDTGIGMDPETMARAFEPFFTTKPEGEGTGLGLATVYGIVRQSGGQVRVLSEPGQGTTVRLYFPIGEEGLELGLPEPRPPGAKRGEAVLVVTDNVLILSLVEEVLSSHGYETLVAPDPRVAVKLAAHSPVPIAVLLTDISLPGMAGPQLAARLTATHPLLRVVYISGFSEIAVDESGSLPVHGILLRKPFTASQLLDAVRAALDD